MVRLLSRLSTLLAKVTGVVVVLLATALVAAIVISIFFRYVVGAALSWPEEISLMIFAWLVLLAGSIGVHDGFHVRLVLLLDRLPGPVRAWVLRAIDAAVAFFGAVLLYSGGDLVARTQDNLTAVLRLPTDIVNWSAIVAGALILVHAASRVASSFSRAEEGA